MSAHWLAVPPSPNGPPPLRSEPSRYVVISEVELPGLASALWSTCVIWPIFSSSVIFERQSAGELQPAAQAVEPLASRAQNSIRHVANARSAALVSVGLWLVAFAIFVTLTPGPGNSSPSRCGGRPRAVALAQRGRAVDASLSASRTSRGGRRPATLDGQGSANG